MTEELSRSEVLNRLRAALPVIRKDFGVVRIGLFGSYARDEGGAESDIDLLVAFEEGKERFRIFFSCIEYLEQLMGKKVELISEHALDHQIRSYVEREVIWI
ncbi:MAG TPA: nucleotidyltransferase family protein [Methanospirillum sp.]|nr:nucleotidyltransferase family protein [Methanospirillum sp.]